MKRLVAVLAVSTAFGVAACDVPYSDDSQNAETSTDTPMALPAEDAAVPVDAPNANDTPRVDPTTLPPEKRSSAESVQPESETLFY